MTEASTTNGNKVLGKDSLVPLGVVAAVMVPVFYFVVTFNDRLSAIDYGIGATREDIKGVKRQVEQLSNSGWSRRDMLMWVQLFQAENKGKDLVVPEVHR